MEIGGCQEIDLQLEADDLIGNFQFPETLDANKEVNSVGIDVNGRLPELHESTEPERNQRNGRHNLRKSLAWDPAFSTNEGVLDPEEMSSMITKSDKNEKHILPGIQEELTGSTESISTLRSDSLILESNDDDLFLDIRASIQRSSKKAPNLINSSSKIAAMVLNGPAISSPKKEDVVSKNKCQKPGVKKTTGLQTVRMSKSQLKPIGKLASGRSIKPDSVQSQAGSIGKSGETNSVVSKPLKTISSYVPSSTAAKRESLGIGRLKPECGSSKSGETNSVVPKRLKTVSSYVPSSTAAKREFLGIGRLKPECGSSKQESVSGKVTQLHKVSALGGSKKVLSKPAVSPKFSSVRSSTTSNMPSTRSSTSSDNSISTSSGNAAKPTLKAARRNLGKSSTNSPGHSGSIPRTPSRALPKNKLPASNLSAYLKSTKLSTSVSPASSISEWSSMSSLRSSYSRSSIDTSSCRSVDGENMRSDPRCKVAGQMAERKGNHGAISSSNTPKKSTSTSGILQAPMKPSDTLQAPTKLSGLRLPSPKIGFFDGSSSRTPGRHNRSPSVLYPVIPKNAPTASTPTRSSNGKLKSSNIPMARMSNSLTSIKSPKAVSVASSQEKSCAFVKPYSVSTGVTDTSSLSDGVKVMRTADDTDNLGDLSLPKNMTFGDITAATSEGNNAYASEYISQIRDNLVMKDELKKNLVPTPEAVKEDGDPATYPGDGLTGDKTGTCEKNLEPNSQLLSDISECALSSTAATSEAAACGSPTTPKNSECVDNPKELVIPVAVAENVGVALPSSGSENIIQTKDGLINCELKKNLIPTSGATEKEMFLRNLKWEEDRQKTSKAYITKTRS
ncbi:nuclear pore complex protein DDB_G0274915-like [Salvia splendens]|uniref:nuclear pore complex protein DDB_G0274915-like n=1 Tax=Salvia splendens TaxID=180675 RepID=UPI001C27A0B5|nr:nuclear pore complex protein DDB_G0274915-like [Salvia splendens]